jgi:DNA-binding NarL/FixJ family response regulator
MTKKRKPLTDRQRTILDLIMHGRSNREIGRALSISEHTVKEHVTAIFGKLGVKNRTAAAVKGNRESLNFFAP